MFEGCTLYSVPCCVWVLRVLECTIVLLYYKT